MGYRAPAKPAPNQADLGLFAPDVPTPRVIDRSNISPALGPASLEEVEVVHDILSMKHLNLANRNGSAGSESAQAVIADPQKVRNIVQNAPKRREVAARARLTAILARQIMKSGKDLRDVLAERQSGKQTVGAALADLIVYPDKPVESIPYFQDPEIKARVAGTKEHFFKEFASITPAKTDAQKRFNQAQKDKRATIIKEAEKKIKEHPEWTLPKVK